jgi:hypothetical protein
MAAVIENIVHQTKTSSSYFGADTRSFAGGNT